jgi:ABC-2 type transport system permease protein
VRALAQAEVARLLSRRVVKLAAGAIVLGVVVAAVVVFIRSNPDATGAVRAAELERANTVSQCAESPEEFFPPEIQNNPEFDPQQLCEKVVEMRPVDPRFHLTDLAQIFKGMTVPLVILAWLLAASFVGAEWRAGSVTTELTWESRRARLLAAKAGAVVAITFVGVVVSLGLLGGALTPSAVWRGTTAGADAAWFRDLIGIVMRAGALSAIAALIGLSIATVGRNTAAALGVGFFYLAVVEGLLRASRPGWGRWFVGDNAVVFVNGSDTSFPPIGRSVTGAGILLALYALGAFAVATLQFQSRDVT